MPQTQETYGGRRPTPSWPAYARQGPAEGRGVARRLGRGQHLGELLDLLTQLARVVRALQQVAPGVAQAFQGAAQGVAHRLRRAADLRIHPVQDERHRLGLAPGREERADDLLLLLREGRAAPRQAVEAARRIVEGLGQRDRGAAQVRPHRRRQVQHRLRRAAEQRRIRRAQVLEGQQQPLRLQDRLVAEGRDPLQLGRHVGQPARRELRRVADPAQPHVDARQRLLLPDRRIDQGADAGDRAEADYPRAPTARHPRERLGHRSPHARQPAHGALGARQPADELAAVRAEAQAHVEVAVCRHSSTLAACARSSRK